MRHRFGVWRIQSRDTYAGKLQTPFSLNRYTYGLNNPTRNWDPLVVSVLSRYSLAVCPKGSVSTSDDEQ
jgi:hypothetical protein